jgi:hypothetical protein
MVLLHLGPADRTPIPPPPGGTEVPDTLLGRPMIWTRHVGDDRVLRAHVPIDAGRALAIMISARDDHTERELLGVVRTLRLRPE